MNIWIVVVLALLAVGGFVLMRLGRARDGHASELGLGEVSQGWLIEQRAGKQRDWS